MSQNQPKIVFITGGNGFIGSNLARFLINKKFTVNILVRNKANIWRLKDIVKNIKIHEGEVEDLSKLKKLMTKINPSYIFHFASYGNSSNEKDFKKIIDINILGLKNLLLASENINYRKLIISGSSSEYGFKSKPMKEDDSLNPNSHYSAAKGAATLIAQSFAREKKKPILILRLFSVYGPYEESNRFIPTIIKRALKKEKIFVTKENVKRDFIYIDDVISAFYKAMNTNIKGGEIFNIGTGKQFSNKDVVNTIEKILKLKLKLGSFPRRTWDTDNWVSDISKAKRKLKWKPLNSIEQGLRKTLEWHQSTI